MPRETKIQVRRDTASNWTSVNPILASGEFGYETDTQKLKFGNGSTAWTGLAYFTGSGGGGSGDALVANPLSQFAATTSAQLAGVISDETGTGLLVFATNPTLTTPNLGTPTSGTLTNCTALPISTGVSGLGSGVATFLSTPTSANLASAITNETGTGLLVFATSPTLVTPLLGTPASGVLTNCTGTATGLTSGISNALKSATTTVDTSASTAPTTGQALIATSGSTATWQTLSGGGNAQTANPLSQFASTTSAQLAGVMSDETGTGSLVFANTPALVTPNIGSATGTSAVLTSDSTINSISIGQGVNSGNSCTRVGDSAMSSGSLTALFCTGMGKDSLKLHNTGNSQTAFGALTLSADTTGSNSVAIGKSALGASTASDSSTAIGFEALKLSSGLSHTAIGKGALAAATGFTFNTAVGVDAIGLGVSGASNTGIGAQTLSSSSFSGQQDTAIGRQTLKDLTSGNDNTALGFGTAQGITTGSSNTIIGANVTGLSSSLSNNIILAIGSGAIKSQFDGTNWTFSGNILSPTLTTPTIGVATATTINKVALTAPATGSTITIADGKTLTSSNTVTLTGTDGVSINLSNNKLVSIGFTVDGGGSAITAGKVKGFFTVPYSGSITAYNIVADAGTCTIKCWKIATGTAKPTSSNSINSSGVSLSTGTAVRSTSLSDFTTTTITANDIFAFNIETVATATEISFNLEITRT